MSARLWMAVVLALPLAASGGEGPKAEEGTVVNSIVAVVNNEPVTQLEVEALVAEFLRNAAGTTPDQLRAARDRAREALIEQRLLVQEARRRNVAVDPEEVNAEVERLKAMGVDAEGRRDVIRERLMISLMLLRLQSARAISPQEVADYYAKHPDDFVLRERRHVFVIAIYARSFGGDKRAARRRAEEVLGRLRKGEDFGALAKKHSDGAFADKGGDYGWLEKGALVGPLDQAASRLKPGEVSELIEAKDGFLIVKVTGVQPASRQSLAEARPKILQRLQAEHRQERRRQLIGSLRKSASILHLDLRPAAATP